MEPKLLLALPLLNWIILQDLKKREINNTSWVALVLLGLISFIYEIIQEPSRGPAAMFTVSLLGGMAFAFLFYSLEWLGGGDALVLIGLSTITYNLLPFPFFVPILMIASFLGLLQALAQRKLNREVDVPFTVHLSLGFLCGIAFL